MPLMDLEARRAYKRKNYHDNLDRYKAQQAKYRANNKERIRATKRAIYVRKVEALAGRPMADKCELCNRPGKVEFDHNHRTGKFRGWLCGRCNRLAGHVEKNLFLIIGIVEYLEKMKGK